MDRASVADWLQRYVDAWKTYDRTKIGALFGDDATYRYHPYDEPVEGRDAIVGSWLEDQDDPDSYEASYEPIAVDGDIAFAQGTSTYFAEGGEVDEAYHNLFVMRFDDAGRCIDFTEWYMKRPKP